MASLFYEIKKKNKHCPAVCFRKYWPKNKETKFFGQKKIGSIPVFCFVICLISNLSQPNTYRNFSHRVVFDSIGSNDDIDVLNNSLEDLVEGLCLKLQCQQSQVHLVHEENWFDSLSNSLSQYSFCLHTHTFKTSSIEFRLGNLGFYWSAN